MSENEDNKQERASDATTPEEAVRILKERMKYIQDRELMDLVDKQRHREQNRGISNFFGGGHV